MKTVISFRTRYWMYVKGVLGIVLLIVINSLVADMSYFNFVIGGMEVVIVLYYLFMRKLDDFLLAFLLFFTTSIENAYYAYGSTDVVFYSFVKLPIIRSYHLYLICLIALGKMLYKGWVIPRGSTVLGKVVRFIVLFWGIGLCMTFITVLFNDNNISRNGLLRYVVRDIQNFFLTFAIMLLSITCLCGYPLFEKRLLRFFEYLLAGTVFGAVILIVFKNYHVMHGHMTFVITMPLVLVLTICLILMYCTEDKPLYFVSVGILSIVIQCQYTTGIAGSLWLMLACVAVMFIFIVIFDRKMLMRLRQIIILVCIASVYFFEYDILAVLNLNYQVQYKLDTFLRLIKRNNIATWYADLGGSIQARLEEMVNIFLEFLNKPLYMFCGKGFGGSAQRYWGISNWNISGATYSDAEINARVYSSFHTGIAEFFINFGILGLVFCLWIIVWAVKLGIKGKHNFWCFIGMWSLILFFNFLSTKIGFVFMAYGFYLYDKNLGRLSNGYIRNC